MPSLIRKQKYIITILIFMLHVAGPVHAGTSNSRYNCKLNNGKLTCTGTPILIPTALSQQKICLSLKNNKKSVIADALRNNLRDARDKFLKEHKREAHGKTTYHCTPNSKHFTVYLDTDTITKQ